MPNAENAFFSTEQNLSAIRSLVVLLRSSLQASEDDKKIASHLASFMQVLALNAIDFDRLCRQNIEWIGDHYVSQIIGYPSLPVDQRSEALRSIFTSSYRFLSEYEYSQPLELSLELRSLKNFVDEHLDLFDGTDRRQLIFASYAMPAAILKRLVHSPEIADFRAFATSADGAKRLKSEWDTELAAKTAELDGLRGKLEQLKTSYNFVGLVKGFEDIFQAKKWERRRSFVAMLLLGLGMLAPIALQMWLIAQHLPELESKRSLLVYALPPLLTAEVVLFYFFRAALINYRAISSQMLQLSLRISLCQFIQSYVDYAKDLKGKDSSALQNFEAIVFSPLSAHMDSMPSTFDGIEHLAKIVANLRGSK